MNWRALLVSLAVCIVAGAIADPGGHWASVGVVLAYFAGVFCADRGWLRRRTRP